jgi:hypothetical protein
LAPFFHMLSKERLFTALKASLAHLILSLLVAVLCATLVFGLWYPAPFDHLAKGREIFILIISIDIICGPLLTLVVFNRNKPKYELWRDMGVIALIQIFALCFGILNLMNARPVWIAFEGDRFRVVSIPDINLAQLHLAPKALQNLSLSGPQLLGVRLATGDDTDFKDSIIQSLNGEPPAFRPARWVPYTNQVKDIVSAAKPLNKLLEKHPAQQGVLTDIAAKNNSTLENLGYMPLLAEGTLEWTVIVGMNDGLPKAYLALDAWD